MKKGMFVDRHALPILSVIVVCTLPHFFNISMWSVMACLAMWGVIFGAAHLSWRSPGRLTRLLLVGIFFLIAMTTNEGFTIEAFVALLALMICMKLLDIRDKNNRMSTVILCYFLIVGSLFFDDSIYATVYMLFSVLSVTAVLMHVNQPSHKAIGYLRMSGILMIQSLPIMILLFVLFPRIQGGVWGRAPIYTAKAGFTDRMAFGDMAEMAQNTAVAFRVEFEDGIPPQEQLYWRGVVLWEFDGHTWYRGVGRRGAAPKRSEASSVVKYTLTLEPHNERWMITLDLPMRISLRRSWLLNDFSYYRWRPISQRVSYSGTSYVDANDITLQSHDQGGVTLPEGINPRARTMATQLYTETSNTTEYVNRVLRYFSEQSFTYTLKPPPLTAGRVNQSFPGKGNLVDSFLFDTRKGFCEHYATAFAFLMRAAGVPARVVVGYLGGSQNRFGGYLVVRQSQAHAWCEVWIEGQGWVRVDPTAAVAPGRLNGDVAGAVPEEELIGLMSYFRGTPLEPWAEPVVGVLDLINSRWNKWVMGYSVFEQESLFSRFGIDLESGAGPVKAFISALVALAVFALAASIVLLYRQKGSQDQLSHAWMEFCLKMAKIGLQRRPAQGPIDFMNFIVKKRPDLEKRSCEIVSMYVKQRYAGQSNPAEIVLLQNLVKQFRPQ